MISSSSRTHVAICEDLLFHKFLKQTIGFFVFCWKEHIIQLKRSGEQCAKQYKSIKFCWYWESRPEPQLKTLSPNFFRMLHCKICILFQLKHLLNTWCHKPKTWNQIGLCHINIIKLVCQCLTSGEINQKTFFLLFHYVTEKWLKKKKTLDILITIDPFQRKWVVERDMSWFWSSQYFLCNHHQESLEGITKKVCNYPLLEAICYQ